MATLATAATHGQSRTVAFVTPTLGLAGFVLWLLAVTHADYGAMGGYGLITVLGWPYYVGLVLVAVAFAVELSRTPLRTPVLLGLVALLAVFMYGTACAVEPVAELTDSWIHAGFIQYILVHGHSLNGYDARFSWPGAFSMAAALVAFAGQSTAVAFLRYFPLFIELAYLAPLLVIARESGVSRRASWLGIALYYCSNWILQDYFSPQALNYLFFLVAIATVLSCWSPRPLPPSRYATGSVRARIASSLRAIHWNRWLGHDAEPVLDARRTTGAMMVLGLVFLASSMSHQLTPYALVLSLLALVAARRLGRPELVALLVVLAIGWLSLGASNYWVGHLGAIFGSAGQFTSKLSTNVTSRVHGAVTHLIVVKARILLTAAIFGLAGVGFLRRATDSRALEALAGAPFFLLVLQSYGGEGLLRVVLYGLPFTSLLAASAVFPRRRGPIPSLLEHFRLARLDRLGRDAARGIVVAIVLVCALATTLVRGGNDAYESFSTGELAAVDFAYHLAKPGQVIGVANYFLPIGQRRVGTVTEFIASSASSTTPLPKVISNLERAKTALVILSRSEGNFGIDVDGYPANWIQQVTIALESKGYRVARRWATATVLQRT